MQMLQSYRVVSAFSAKELHREPLWMESFELEDLLVIVSSEDGFTTFCRKDEASDLAGRNHFISGNREFRHSTEKI